MQNNKYTIGVILGNANSPHTIETIKGIREASKELQVNIMCYAGVHSSYFFKDYFSQNKEEDFDYQVSCIYDYIELSNVDALILSYGTLSIFLNNVEIAQFFRKFKNIPSIILESRLESQNTAYIIGDNYNGEMLIMKHLISYHGYRNILYLSGPKGNIDADERLKAYVDAMNENNLEWSDKTVAHGDFSESVTNEINKLLDDNPDAEALVCANDKMAITAYAVLKERKALYDKACEEGDAKGMKRYYKNAVGRGVNGGHGIAITGYDNVSESENIDPPLTTVAQNAYANGYKAVCNAISLVKDGKAESMVTEPKLIIRNSCGCESDTRMDIPVLNEYYRTHPDIYAAQVAYQIKDCIVLSDVSDRISDIVYDELNAIVNKHLSRYVGLTSGGFSVDDIVEDFKYLINSEYERFISMTSLSTAISDYVSSVIRYSDDVRGKELILEAASRINEYIHSRIYTDAMEMVSVYEHRTWFMPLISRDMANYLDSEKEMYRNAMTKMKVLGMGNTYLFMLKEPIKHKKNAVWVCPEELRLVAYQANDEVYAFDYDEAEVVDKNNPLDKYFKNGSKPYYASAMGLFSGEYQYGVLLAEIAPENVLSLYYASVQISTALKYCEMARTQKYFQKQLENMIEEVEKKNEILRSISEYDQLTGCLNRRGFLERAIETIGENEGKNAIIVFADLDHLKEINDRYGHSEGDFAIENTANILKASLPESAVLSRLGGDEFVALVVSDGNINGDTIIREVKETILRFNAFLTKPYYVECSVGTNEFICNSDVKIEEVMDGADEALYDAKANRRKSVIKSVRVW